jgi:GTP-binding protein YchF
MIKIAIIGLPQSGKTTVFRALTGTMQGENQSLSHIRNVKVPDERLGSLAEVIKPKKITGAEINFVDEHMKAGIEQESFNLVHSKEADALVCVVRDFENTAVAHPKGNIDPKRDILEIQTELFVNDLQITQNRLERIEKEIKKGKKELSKELDLMNKLKQALEGETPLRRFELSREEQQIIKGFEFLTIKRELVLINTDENKINVSINEEIKKIASAKDFALMKFSARIEAELEELEPAEREEFLKSYNIKELAIDKFIKTVYQMLEIVTFFTVKNEQLRAWTIRKGTNAKEAAGKIHSDMERGFIKAEVVNFDDFKQVGFDFHNAKQKGLLKLEGKDYEVRDGDIIDFRFSV